MSQSSLRLFEGTLFYLLQSEERIVLTKVQMKCYSTKEILWPLGLFFLLLDHRNHPKGILALCKSDSICLIASVLLANINNSDEDIHLMHLNFYRFVCSLLPSLNPSFFSPFLSSFY